MAFAIRLRALPRGRSRCHWHFLARLRAPGRPQAQVCVRLRRRVDAVSRRRARKPCDFFATSFERTEARRRSCGGRMRSEAVSCRSVQGEGQSPARRVALDGCRAIRSGSGPVGSGGADPRACLSALALPVPLSCGLCASARSQSRAGGQGGRPKVARKPARGRSLDLTDCPRRVPGDPLRPLSASAGPLVLPSGSAGASLLRPLCRSADQSRAGGQGSSRPKVARRASPLAGAVSI